MLLIHTREHQRIIIAESIDLELTAIHYYNGNSSIDYKMSQEEIIQNGSLAVGDMVELIHGEVLLYFNKAVNVDGTKIATLGFEASRSISIRGEWIRTSR